MSLPWRLLASIFDHIVLTHLPNMSDYLPTTTYLPPIKEFGQHAPGRESKSSASLFCSLWPTGKSSEPTGKIPDSPIHTLNDHVLLNVFYLYRLDVLDEYDEDSGLNGDWRDHRWWYNLAQVCRWWRYLILASPSQLDLHLLCTYAVPIANMLAHSPPLPLTILYHEGGRETTEEDDEGILLTLRHSDRLHYIYLNLSSLKLQKIITIMDEEFPILERMYIWSRTEGDRSLVLPRAFQAPHLRHLALSSIALPIGSPLLTSTVGLITLRLADIPPSAYFSPNYLLTGHSLMPQLENLGIRFYSPLCNRDVEKQSLNTPIMAHITLPNLCLFIFKGVSTYLEGLLNWIRAPLLSELDIEFFNQLTFTVPRLLQFLDTLETLSFGHVQLTFSNDSAEFKTFQLEERGGHPFSIKTMCRHLDWQVSFAIQILTALQPVLLRSGVFFTRKK